MKKKVVLLSVVFLLALMGVLTIKLFPIIQGRLYLGNRINMDISVYFNGELIDIKELEVRCKDPRNVYSDIEMVDSRYCVRGGTYGAYTYTVVVPAKYIGDTDENITVELVYINANSWYISYSKCVIKIEEQDGIRECSCEIKTKVNDGTSTDYLKESPIESGIVQFTWGL